MPVNVTCFACGGPAGSRKESQITKNQTGAYYCSMECRTSKRTLNCAACETPIVRHAYRITDTMYCSNKCRHGLGQFTISVLDGDPVALIPLRDIHNTIVAHAIVDADKAEWVSQWRWHLSPSGYASRVQKTKGVRVHIHLHRRLLGLIPGDGFEGDHINRQRLDNRLSNLRAVPKAGNRQNTPGIRTATSQYRGVSWDKRLKRWAANVKANGVKHALGFFTDELEAAEAARAGRARLLPYAVD